LADGRNNFGLWRSAVGRHSQEETELRKEIQPALNIMLKQMDVPPDFASAVKRSTQR
jgi:hypothetical protein